MSESLGGVGGDSQTGRKSPIAARAREIADRIDKLPDQVQDAFSCGKSRESRARHICSLADEIRCDMLPVVNFIERRRPPGTARLFLNRIENVLRGAETCASLDIPEWASGVKPPLPIPRNLARAARLSVVATLTAASIRGWADDIETEEVGRGGRSNRDRARAPKSPTTGKSSGRKRIDDPREDKIMNAWNSGDHPTYLECARALGKGYTESLVETVVKRVKRRENRALRAPVK